MGTVAFRDFVRFLHDGGRPLDPHWVGQAKRLMLDMISYDFIGRYEAFARDFTTVMERLNAPEEVRVIGATPHGLSYKIPLAVAYDSPLAGIVYKMYEDDFETFDYERDSWMFIGE